MESAIHTRPHPLTQRIDGKAVTRDPRFVIQRSAEDMKGVHGIDERLSLENLRLGLETRFDVAVAAA